MWETADNFLDIDGNKSVDENVVNVVLLSFMATVVFTKVLVVKIIPTVIEIIFLSVAMTGTTCDK